MKVNPLLTSTSFEVTTRVALCGRSLTIAGQTLTPDEHTAYLECRLAHAFPVTTCDSTALHPAPPTPPLHRTHLLKHRAPAHCQ